MYLMIFTRFKGGISSWPAILFATISTLLPLVLVSGEDGVHLEYYCVDPDPVEGEEENVPVIMLHGIVDSKETWNGICENISSSTHRKVCAYDARNHGGSSWNDTFTIDSLVEDLGIFMKRLHIERAVLVGHSMGGVTAMKFAFSNPDKVAGIFVEDIGIKQPEVVEIFVRFAIKLMVKSLSAIEDGADGPSAKKAVVDYITKKLKVKIPESVQKQMPLHLVNGVWQFKSNLELIQKFMQNSDNFHPKIEGSYNGKALFIYGTFSLFGVGEQKEDIWNLFPNATFVAVKGANHIIHFEYPEFLEELLNFLK